MRRHSHRNNLAWSEGLRELNQILNLRYKAIASQACSTWQPTRLDIGVIAFQRVSANICQQSITAYSALMNNPTVLGMTVFVDYKDKHRIDVESKINKGEG